MLSRRQAKRSAPIVAELRRRAELRLESVESGQRRAARAEMRRILHAPTLCLRGSPLDAETVARRALSDVDAALERYMMVMTPR